MATLLLIPMSTTKRPLLSVLLVHLTLSLILSLLTTKQRNESERWNQLVVAVNADRQGNATTPDRQTKKRVQSTSRPGYHRDCCPSE